jgi:hypothetical protein
VNSRCKDLLSPRALSVTTFTESTDDDAGKVFFVCNLLQKAFSCVAVSRARPHHDVDYIVERAISELQERIDKLEEENEALRNEMAQASKLDNPRGEQKKEQEMKEEHLVKKQLLDEAVAGRWSYVDSDRWLDIVEKACLPTSPIKDYAVHKVKEAFVKSNIQTLEWDDVVDVQDALIFFRKRVELCKRAGGAGY